MKKETIIMAGQVSATRLKKALQETQEHANQITASMAKLDKEKLYAATAELDAMIAEDPMLEDLFADELKAMRMNLRFIAKNSGIVKNAQNVSKAVEEAVAKADRFLKSEKN